MLLRDPRQFLNTTLDKVFSERFRVDFEIYDPSLALLCCTYVNERKPTVAWGISYLESEADFRDRLFEHVSAHGLEHLDWIYILMPNSPLAKELVSYNAFFSGTADETEYGELELIGVTYDDLNRIRHEIYAQAAKVKKPTVVQFDEWLKLQMEES